MRDHPLLALFMVMAPFSLLSFGGGPSIFAPLQHEAVDVMGWVTTREFIDMFSIARTAPGPGAMLTTLIGWKVAGWSGALVATLGLFLPGSILYLCAVRVYDRYRGRDWHTALEIGLGPVAVGLIVAGALAILRLSDGKPLPVIVALGAGIILMYRTKVNPFVILFGGAGIFVLAEFLGYHP